MRQIYYLPILLLFCVLCYSNSAYATHAMGGEITYECLGPNSAGNNVYKIRATFYYDCASSNPFPTTLTLDYTSTCQATSGTLTLIRNPCPIINGVSNCEITTYCGSSLASNCGTGSLPGIREYVYEANLTLPHQCNDWRISYNVCCRNNAITNLTTPGSHDIFIYANINNAGGLCNNSPFFTTAPVPMVCANVPFNYNHGAVDPEGDSLAFSIIQTHDTYLNLIPFVGGFSITYPLTTSSGTFGFDPQTGQMSFTPVGQQFAVITVQVREYRNGVLIGTTMRDIQLVVLNDPSLCNNQPPDLSPADSITGAGVLGPSSFQVCPNVPISFQIPAFDNANDTITMSSNVSTSIPGATFSITNNNSPNPTGHFAWTPTINDAFLNTFQITLTDNGCPLNMSQTFTFDIYVFDKVTIAGPDTIVYCGDSIELNALGGTYFQWTPGTGLSDSTIANPKVAPLVPTVYSVTSDCGTDSVFVDVQPSFVVDAGNDTQICLHGQTQLNATASPVAQGPYTWLWSPSDSLSNTAVPDPIASPTDTTVYTVTAVSAVGCVKTDSVTVIVAGVAPQVTALISPDTACPGELVQLDISTKPGICGISQLNCNAPLQTFTIGTGSSFTSTGTLYKGFWEDSRVQYLFKASELLAMGFTGGRIEELAFDIASKNSTQPYQGFSIKMGCTNLASLPSSFVTGLTTVFSPKTITTTAGWNTHVLDFPYDWDGTENIIIEVCFNNISYTSDDNIHYTPTGFTSVLYRNADGVIGCNLTSPSTGFNRPNIRFNACQQTLTGAAVAWSSPLGTITSPQSIATTAHSLTSTSFIVDVDDGNGCIGSSFVDLIIDNSLTIDAGPDLEICTPGQIQLNVVANGNPEPITLVCGANNTACPSPQVKSFGTGATQSAQPSPYMGNTKVRTQYLYRASELQAQGITTGVISSLAFNVTAKNSNSAFNNLTIKMGCTGTTAFSSAYVNGLTTVYNAPTYTTTAGWNTHNLDQTFDWDGTSNILIEVTYNNPGSNHSGGGAHDFIASTTTSYSSVLYTEDNWFIGLDSSMAFDPGLSIQNGNRPNVRFSMCEPPPGEFSVTWSPTTGLSDSTILDPIADVTGDITYVVSVMDQSGCNATDTLNITFTSTFTLNIGAEHIGCSGNPFGTAWVELAGLTNYTVEWSTSEITDTITNLSPGTYTVTVEDGTGCIGSSSITIVTSSAVYIDSIISTDATCAGISDGSASVFVSGGAAPYSYTWGGLPDDTADVTGLAAGTYYVTVTDAGQCVATDSVIIGEPASLDLTTSVTDAACQGIDDGTASVSVTGGTPGYTFLWSNSDITDTATGLAVGSHTVIVTDLNSCSDSATVVINSPPSITYTLTSTDVSCNGADDGTAGVTATGGTLPYTYLWQPSLDSTANVTDLAAGTHTFTITNSLGCSVTDSVIITAPDSITIELDSSNETFTGAGNGSAWIDTIFGGAGGYSWVWSNSILNADTIKNLTSGIYTVTVTDANGCTDTASIEVTEPLPLTVVPNVQNASCAGGSDGSVEVAVSGGTSPYSYLWDTPASNTTAAVTGLPAGIYTVIVTDAGGGSDTSTLTITEPDPIVLTGSATDATCFGSSTGSVAASAIGGNSPYTFTWSGGLPSQPVNQGVAADVYSVTVTDANGCIDSLTLTVGEPAEITYSVSSTAVSCGGYSDGSATVVVTGGGNAPFTILWSSNDTSFTANDLMAGTFTFTITDSLGCSASDSVLTTEPDSITIILDASDATFAGASNGVVWIDTIFGGAGGYTWEWSNNIFNDTIIDNLTSGIYSVTATDANGCTVTASIEVMEPLPLTLIPDLQNVNCAGGSDGGVAVLVSGGTSPYSYLWNTPASDTTAAVTGLLAGVYTVVVTDAGGGTDSSTLTLTEPDPIVLTGSATDALCFGTSTGSVSVSAIGGNLPYTFIWSDGLPTQPVNQGVPAGMYTVTVTDGNGCQDSLTLTVSQPAEIMHSVITVAASCGGYSDGSATVTVNSGGNAPFSILWNTNQTTFTVNDFSVGVYTYTITDSTGCTSSGTATITEPAPVTATLIKTNITCNGEADGTLAVSNISGGQSPYTYLWSTGDSTSPVTNLTAGTYTVTITDALGCTVSSSETIIEPTILQITTTISSISCNSSSNGSISANVSGGTIPYGYLWSNGATTQTASGLTQGTYSVTVTDANGCTISATDSLSEPIQVSVDLIVTDEVCPDANDGTVIAVASGGTGPYQYQLNGSGGSSNSTGIFTGLPGGFNGSLLVTDSYGCTFETSIDIALADPISVTFANPVETINLGSSVQLEPIVTAGSVTEYIWEPPTGLDCIDCENPYAAPYNNIQYKLTVIDDRGCAASAEVAVEVINPMYLFIPNAFTPNGDDNNDEFRVYGEAINSVGIDIYNRWGEMVFQSRNMNVGWDGTIRGDLAPPGVYLYVVDIVYIDGRKTNRTGSISLIR